MTATNIPSDLFSLGMLGWTYLGGVFFLKGLVGTAELIKKDEI